jgi:hypothetical protein
MDGFVAVAQGRFFEIRKFAKKVNIILLFATNVQDLGRLVL